jgi:signal transduction histidine kinase
MNGIAVLRGVRIARIGTALFRNRTVAARMTSPSCTMRVTMLTQLRALLFPSAPDAAFHQELLEDARAGTLVVGGLEVLLALTLPLPKLVAGVALGLATLGTVRVGGLYERLRFVLWISAAVWAIWIATGITGAAIVVATFVLLPQRTVEAAVFAVALGLLNRGLLPVLPVALFSPVLYRFRRDRYDSQVRLVQSTQELRLQQERALSAEHAASLERLAAAMSHELNTPVGAIKSSVQTLRSISEKYESATESRRKNLDALHTNVCECLLDSTSRVQTIVARLQRLTSLDRAAVRPTDINEVLQDVAAAVEASTSHEVPIRLNLHPLPKILCETQAWITILTRLVSNAVSQPGQRMLELTSEFGDGFINVDLTESGRTMDPALMARALEPAFAEAGGRIGTSNWNLFQVRGWIRQLGGDLRLSNEANGTTARLTIPVQNVAEAAVARQ